MTTLEVKSLTYPNTFYTIDLKHKNCSCPSMEYRKKDNFLCKHLKSSSLEIKSMTYPNTFYTIDVKKKNCSCPSMEYRKNDNFLCKHLK